MREERDFYISIQLRSIWHIFSGTPKTKPFSPSKPVVRTSEMKGPICFGGKFVTQITQMRSFGATRNETAIHEKKKLLFFRTENQRFSCFISVQKAMLSCIHGLCPWSGREEVSELADIDLISSSMNGSAKMRATSLSSISSSSGCSCKYCNLTVRPSRKYGKYMGSTIPL